MTAPTKREILEACAKAMGYDFEWLEDEFHIWSGLNNNYMIPWNPFDSNDDCALLMDEMARRGYLTSLRYYSYPNDNSCWYASIGSHEGFSSPAAHANDIGAARRMAVCMAVYLSEQSNG